MWLSLLVLLPLCAVGKTEENTTQSPAGKETLSIARGKLIVSSFMYMHAITTTNRFVLTRTF